MRILALDLATTVGWACSENRDTPTSGVFNLPQTGENYELLGSHLRYWLNQKVTAFEPHLMVIEKPIHLRTDTVHLCRILYGLAHQARLVAFDRCIKRDEIAVQTIRTHFLGKNYQKHFPGSEEQKRATIAECRARGWEPRDHNAADALALLDLVRARQFEGFNSRRQMGAAA